MCEWSAGRRAHNSGLTALPRVTRRAVPPAAWRNESQSFSAGAGGGISMTPGSGINPAAPAFQAAQESCQHLLPGGGALSGPPNPRAKAQMLKMSNLSDAGALDLWLPRPAQRLAPGSALRLQRHHRHQRVPPRDPGLDQHAVAGVQAGSGRVQPWGPGECRRGVPKEGLGLARRRDEPRRSGSSACAELLASRATRSRLSLRFGRDWIPLPVIVHLRMRSSTADAAPRRGEAGACSRTCYPREPVRSPAWQRCPSRHGSGSAGAALSWRPHAGRSRAGGRSSPPPRGCGPPAWQGCSTRGRQRSSR